MENQVLNLKRFEVEALMQRLESIARMLRHGAFSFGNLPREHQMPNEIKFLVKHITKNPLHMMYYYHYLRITDNIKREPHSNIYIYEREFDQMIEYLKKAIEFYEWCNKS